MSLAHENRNILIGTAGHIDHGKTRLVARLTGIETDRLPEEKTRGISIDLGFAHWSANGYTFGVVDVPGHERFVRNMVAGATGVNLALLVVAADDGVMPQTREHIEIMDLLGVRAGVVAVTKIDLVEPGYVELVVEELRELLSGTFLGGCEIVPVSSESGAGLDSLKQSLEAAADRVEPAASQPLFRMPIDRVFSLPGHGTIATGSVFSGNVQTGDVLELLPDGREVRIRSVEHHGAAVAHAAARQRTAVNLAGVKVNELARGQELATPASMRKSNRLIVRLRSLSSSPVPLKDRITLNLHLGTTETHCQLNLKGRPLPVGGKCFAELRTKQPVVATHGQSFILRRLSPAMTVAGGTILEPFVAAGRRIKNLDEYGAAMESPDEHDRLAYFLSHEDHVDESPLESAWRAGVTIDRYASHVEQLTAEGVLVDVESGDRRRRIHRDRLDALATSVMRIVRREIARRQPCRSLERMLLTGACRDVAPEEIIEAVFDALIARKSLVQVGSLLGPSDLQAKLTKRQQQARTSLLESIRNAGLLPPTIKELCTSTGQSAGQLEPLLKLCAEDGLLVRVSADLFFSPEALERGRSLCENLLVDSEHATMSELRSAWGVSRKFSVPLCEYFDKLSVTIRKGDVRTAGPSLSRPLKQASAGEPR